MKYENDKKKIRKNGEKVEIFFWWLGQPFEINKVILFKCLENFVNDTHIHKHSMDLYAHWPLLFGQNGQL